MKNMLLLLLSGCIQQPNFPKSQFKYNQKVEIVCDFYAGSVGVIRRYGQATKDERGYLVSIDKAGEEWMPESCIRSKK
jgi:hypothetical protein